MKRILAVVFIIVCAFTFSACGNGEETQGYLEILQSGTYRLQGNGIYRGQHLMILAYVDQGNIVASFRNDNDTPKSVAYEDSKYYLFSESNRLRAEISEDYLSPNVFIPLVHYDFDTAEYKNSGKQEITGTTYYFDRYTIKMTDGTETLLEIYIDDTGNLYGIAFPQETTAITVAELDPELEDYEYTTLSDTEYTDVDPRQIETLLGY